MEPEVTTDHEETIRYLATDAFANLMSLKMLTVFPHACTSALYKRDTKWASRVELGVNVSSWNRAEYPRAELVVMLNGNSVPLLRYALERSPAGSVVFKVHDRWSRLHMKRGRRFNFANSFLSYTRSPLDLLKADAVSAEAEQHSHFSDEAAALLAMNGYDEKEFQLHLSRGAQWFAIRDNNRPVSICLVFQNFRDIWEIGGVFTLPKYRLKGYAKAVVRTALGYFAEHALTPRYQFHYQNTESRHLAESLGLQLRLTVDHFLRRE